LVNVSGNGTLTAWYTWNGKVLGSGLVKFLIYPAKCEPISFGGSNMDNGSSSLFTVGNYSADAPACSGYTSPLWTDSGALQITSVTANPTTVWVKGNGTLTVTYSQVSPPLARYELSFVVAPASCGPVSFNGTTESNGSSAQFLSGTYPGHALSCSGYAFSNWTYMPTGGADSVYTTTWVNVSISSNATMTASYVQQIIPPPTYFTVNFVVNPTSCGPITFNGTSQANQSLDTFLANSYPANAPTCTGYTFNSWSADGNLTLSGSDTSSITVTVSGNGTLAASYFKTTSGSPVLSSVRVSPMSVTVYTGDSETFTATPVCTGGTCPSGATYLWSLNNALGKLNTTTGSIVSVTAGNEVGNVTLFVNATLNSVTKQSGPASIAIVVGPGSGSQSLLSNSMFWILVIVAAVVVIAVLVFVLTRKPKAGAASPAPEPVQEGPPPPQSGYPQWPPT
jgi:hypothetical protein